MNDRRWGITSPYGLEIGFGFFVGAVERCIYVMSCVMKIQPTHVKWCWHEIGQTLNHFVHISLLKLKNYPKLK